MVGLPLSQPLALNGHVPASQTLLFPDPRPLVERLGHDFFRRLTKRPGVYLMQDAAGLVLYVGKAKNLRQRLGSYRVANPDRLGRRHLRLLRQVARIELQECPDETTALAREAELLLALKPKFNCAGVWTPAPRFLIWRSSGVTLELAITETPAAGWQVFGPFGSGVNHLRAALVRLLWYALNSASGSASMPEGWVHGRFGAIAVIAEVKPCSTGVETMLPQLFGGDTDLFVSWIDERTKALTRSYDLELREADLETVLSFMRTQARRPLPFTSSAQNVVRKRTEPNLSFRFEQEDRKNQ